MHSLQFSHFIEIFLYGMRKGEVYTVVSVKLSCSLLWCVSKLKLSALYNNFTQNIDFMIEKQQRIRREKDRG